MNQTSNIQTHESELMNGLRLVLEEIKETRDMIPGDSKFDRDKKLRAKLGKTIKLMIEVGVKLKEYRADKDLEIHVYRLEAVQANSVKKLLEKEATDMLKDLTQLNSSLESLNSKSNGQAKNEDLEDLPF